MNKNDLLQYMENSILQENKNKTTGASVVRSRATAPSVIDMGRFGDEYEQRKSIREQANAPLYEDSGLLDYLKDSFYTFNDTRLSTSIDEERGKLTLGVKPRQRDVDYQIQHLEAKKAYDALQSQLSTVQPGSDAYKEIESKRNEAWKILNDTAEGYDSIVAANGEKSLDKLYSEKDELAKTEQDYIENIEDYRESLKKNREYEVSAGYKAREQRAMEKGAPLSESDTWLYGMPGIMGSSMTSWQAQAANMAYNLGVWALAAGGVIATPFTGGASLAATAGAVAAGAGAVGMSVATNIYSRREESHAEVFDAKRGKVLADLQKEGLDSSYVASAARIKLESEGVDTKDFDDSELSDMVISGEVSVDNDKINKALLNSEGGLTDLYQKNMALSTSDVVQDAVTFIPVGGAIKGVLKPVAKAAGKVVEGSEKLSKVAKKLKDIPEISRKFNNKLIKNAARARMAGAVKAGKILAVDAILEGFEEGSQMVFKNQYDAGEKDNSWLSNALDVIPAYGEVASVITGINRSSELANDPEFYTSFNSGIALGMLMGGAPTLVQQIGETEKKAKAISYTNNVIANQIANKDAFVKAETYVNRSVNNKQEQVLEALDMLKDRLPDGITVEDIDTEIKHAKKVMNLANSVGNKKLAKDLNIDVKSDKYSKLIGIQDYHSNAVDNLLESGNELKKDLNTKFNDLIKNNQIKTRTDDPTKTVENLLANNSASIQFQLDAIDSILDSLNDDAKIANEVITYLGDVAKNLESRRSKADYEDNKQYTRTMAAMNADPDLMNQVRANILNDAALNYHLQEQAKFASVKDSKGKVNQESVSYIVNALDEIDKGREETYNLFADAMKDHNEKTVEAREELAAEATEAAVSENKKDLEKEVEKPEKVKSGKKVESPKTTEAPKKDNSVDDEYTQSNAVEDVAEYELENYNALSEDEAIGLFDDETGKIVDLPKENKEVVKTEPKTKDEAPETKETVVEKPEVIPAVESKSEVKPETKLEEKPTTVESVKDESVDDDDAFDDFSLGEYEEKSYSENSKAAEGPVNHKAERDAIRLDKKGDLLGALAYAIFQNSSNRDDDNVDAQLRDIFNDAITKFENGEYDAMFDLWSNVMFFQPDATTPMNIVVNGNKIDVLPGSELKKVSGSEDITSSDFEYVIGDKRPGTTERDIYILIRRDGKTYATAFRTIDSVNKLAKARLEQIGEYLGPQADNDQVRDILSTMYKRSLEKFARSRNEIIAAWGQKGDNQRIVPNSVTRSSGAIATNRKDGVSVKRPIQEVEGLLPADFNIDTVTIGISDGDYTTAGAYRVYDTASKMEMNAYGGFGDVFIQVTSPTGKPVPVMIDKQKVGAIPGLVDFIYESLVDGMIRTKNGKYTGIPTSAFLSAFIGYGEHTVPRKGWTTIDPDKAFLIAGDYIQLGDKQYLKQDLSRHEREIKEHLAKHINVKADRDNFWAPIRTVLDISTLFNDTDKVEFGPFVITKEMAEYENKTTAFEIIMKANGYVSNTADGIFTLPFLRAEGVHSEELSTPDPQKAKEVIEETPVRETVTVNTEASSSTDPVKAESVYNAGTFMTSDELEQKLKEGNYEDPFELVFGDLMKGAHKIAKSTGKKITAKEIQWLRNSVGLTEGELIIYDSFLSGVKDGGMQAMGNMRHDCITISKLANKGVAYHEGFHRVSLLLLTEKERDYYYGLMAKRLGLTLDTMIEQKAIEEALADDFAKYAVSPYRHILYPITKLFRRLMRFVKIFGEKSDNQLSDLYHEILNGKFKDAEVDKASLNRFKSIYDNEGAWFSIGGDKFENVSLKDYKETINTLVAAIFQVNNVALIGEASKIRIGAVKQLLNPVSAAANKNLTPAQVAARTELYDKFDTIIAKELQYQLTKYAIRAVDLENEQDSLDNANGDAARSDMASHTKSSHEVSWKDNALAAAKLFIATIPASDNNGNMIVNATTGLPTFVDFGKSWNRTLNLLHDQTTVEGLLNKAAELGKTDFFFKRFSEKLDKVKSEYVRTQLLNTISTAYHNMVEVNSVVKVDDDGNAVSRLYVNDANLKRAARELPMLWNGLFVEKFFELSGDIRKIKTDSIKQVFDTLEASKKLNGGNLNVPMVVGALNSLGVMVDANTLEVYSKRLTNVANPDIAFKNAMGFKGGLMQVLEQISKLNSDSKTKYKGKIINPTTMYLSFDPIVDLAKIHAELNPNTSELTVIGPDNSLLYPISSHNYLSQTVQRLNTDLGLIKDMLKVTYNGGGKSVGSRVLNHLYSGKKIQFNTLVSFRVDKTGDSGRKYADVSPKEDYVTNFALTENGHLIPPTMGDSTTRNTISGIPMFKTNGDFKVINGKETYVFSDEILSQFWNYFVTEYNTIVENYKNEPLLDAEPWRKVKNYHKGTRNGYRFRYFGTLPFGGKFDDLDARLIKAEKEDGDDKSRPATNKLLMAIGKMIKEYEDSGKNKEVINDLLKSRLGKELEYASSIGVIDYDSKNPFETVNNSLDQEIVAEKTDKFNGTDSERIAKATIDAIARFYANSAMSTIEFEKIFIKDPAYYKWALNKEKTTFVDRTVDKIKRVREVLSTGVIPRTDYDLPGKDGETTFRTATFNDVQSSSKYFDTIKDLANRSYGINLLRIMHNLTDEQAIKIYDDPSLFGDKKFDNVRNALKARSDNFAAYGEGRVNQTDATVLISPEFYKQLIRRVDGWNESLEEAFKILSDPNNDWVNNLDANTKSLELILKPLKFMYFGDHFDSQLGLNVPVFNKMAMFPVFPAFVKGSDAQHVYDMMVGRNIDMIAFDSAVKVGMKESMDVFGKDAEGEIIMNPKLGDLHVYNQQYSQLKRQLLTDPHHAERQMFVSQAFKAAMGSIRKDRKYKHPQTGKTVTGKELKAEIKEAFDALTRDGFDRAVKDLGFSESDNGKFNLDLNRFYAALYRNAKNSDMNVNVLDGLSTHAPLSSLSDNNWIETSITSTLNREIVDTRLPGGMFIQMSSFMYNNITSDKSMNRKLNEVNPDGSMDAIISLNLLKHILPKDKVYTFNEARQWLLDNNVIGNHEGVKPIAMGYRIPAQGQSSLSPLRFVDIWPEQLGDTITLPDAFTTQTGSDFDVDKLFVARYNFKLKKEREVKRTEAKKSDIDKLKPDFEEWKQSVWVVKNNVVKYNADRSNSNMDLFNMFCEENELPYYWNKSEARYEKFEAVYSTFIPKYNYDKTPDENNRAANENKLLDNLLAVITNPLNFSETRVPLDVATDNVKTILENKIEKFIEKVKSVNAVSFLTPSFQSETKRSLAGGKKGIGPFALSTAHHVLAQYVDLSFAPKLKSTLAVFGISEVSGITDDKYVPILDWLSAMINAHVDTAKDPYIIRMNVVPYTYNMTAFLLRSGVGSKSFLFLAQKAIKDSAAAAQEVSGYLNVDNTKTEFERVREAVEKVKNEYIEKAASLAKNDSQLKTLRNLSFDEIKYSKALYATAFDENALEADLKEQNTFEWYKRQVLYLSTFEILSAPAKALSELTTLSQIDTKKFGNNFALYQQYLNRLKRFIIENKVFYNAGDVFKKTFLYEKIDYAINRPLLMMQGKLLRTNHKFVIARNKILAMIGAIETNDEILIRNVNRAMESHIKGKFFKSRISEDRANELLYGEQSIPTRLRKLKEDILNGKYPKLLGSDGKLSNALFEMIDKAYKFDEIDLSLPDFIKYNENKTISDVDNQLILSWEELLDLGNDPDYSEIGNFAKDLVDYAYLTSGDNFGKNTLFAYVPNSYRNTIGYTDYMSSLENTVDFSQEDIDKIIRSMWFDNNVVPEIDFVTTSFDYELNQYVENVLPNLSMPSSHRQAIKIGDKTYGYPILFSGDRESIRTVGEDENGIPVYQPYVKIKIGKSSDPRLTLLYQLVGVQNVLTEEGLIKKVIPVYKVVGKLGMKHHGNIVSDIFENSIIPFNNTAGMNSKVKDLIQRYINLPLDTPGRSYVFSLLGLTEDGYKTSAEKIKAFDYKVFNKFIENISVDLDSLFEEFDLENIKVSDDNSINIHHSSGDNASLSNFAERPFSVPDFTVNGTWVNLKGEFRTVEHAFQMAKVFFLKEDKWDKEDRRVMYAIDSAITANDAREVGRSIKGLDTEKWEAASSEVMKTLIKASFESNPEAKDRLLSTVGSKLTHINSKSPDKVNRWTTEFPRILTEVRDEFVKDLETTKLSETTNNEPNIATQGELNVVENEAETKTVEEVDNAITKVSTDSTSKIIEKTDNSAKPETNEFTFSDGYSIKVPFKLNDEQINALNELEEFVKNPESKTITLSGYAGTGKTTILGLFYKYVRRRKEVVFTAVSHRANMVTRANTKGAEVKTLASLLGLSPNVDIESTNFDLRKTVFEATGNINGSQNGILVVDEASMVSDSLYDLLNEYAKAYNNKIIYVGDSAQLRPVKQNRISKVFTNNSGKVLQLTKVERTGDNPILNESTRLRKHEGLTYESALTPKNSGVVYISNFDEVKEYLSNFVKKDYFTKNPLGFRILSPTNEVVGVYNSIVRSMLYGDNALQIQPGEMLMGYDNKGYLENNPNMPYKIMNSCDYIVSDVKESTKSVSIETENGKLEKVKLEGFNVTLSFPMNEELEQQRVFVVSNYEASDNLLKIHKRIDQLWARQKQLRSIKPIDYNSVKEIMAEINMLSSFLITMVDVRDETGALKIKKSLDYGYAHTIHKSQGGTYSNTLVLDTEIDKFGSYGEGEDIKSILENRNELRYVAMSRASNFVAVLTKEENITEKALDNILSGETNLSNVISDEDVNSLAEKGKERKKECE